MPKCCILTIEREGTRGLLSGHSEWVVDEVTFLTLCHPSVLRVRKQSLIPRVWAVPSTESDGKFGPMDPAGLRRDHSYDFSMNVPDDERLDFENATYLGKASARWPDANGEGGIIHFYIFLWTDENGDRVRITYEPSQLIELHER